MPSNHPSSFGGYVTVGDDAHIEVDAEGGGPEQFSVRLKAGLPNIYLCPDKARELRDHLTAALVDVESATIEAAGFAAEPVSSLSGLPETLAALKATKAIAVGAIEILRTDRADLVILVAYMAAEGFTPNQIAYAVENPWKYTDVLAAAKAALAKGSW